MVPLDLLKFVYIRNMRTLIRSGLASRIELSANICELPDLSNGICTGTVLDRGGKLVVVVHELLDHVDLGIKIGLLPAVLGHLALADARKVLDRGNIEGRVAEPDRLVAHHMGHVEEHIRRILQHNARPGQGFEVRAGVEVFFAPVIPGRIAVALPGSPANGPHVDIKSPGRHVVVIDHRMIG